MIRGPLPARVQHSDGGQVELLSPAVGVFVSDVVAGSELKPGDVLGRLHVLGKRRVVTVPEDVHGVVVEHVVEQAVDYASRLSLLATKGTAATGARVTGASTSATGAVVFVAPMSGRFYRSPSPDEPAFVNEGDEISAGTVIGLLEVMKTFNRLAYGGDGLPARAKIARIVPADGADLNRGAPILELGPLP